MFLIYPCEYCEIYDTICCWAAYSNCHCGDDRVKSGAQPNYGIYTNLLWICSQHTKDFALILPVRLLWDRQLKRTFFTINRLSQHNIDFTLKMWRKAQCNQPYKVAEVSKLSTCTLSRFKRHPSRPNWQCCALRSLTELFSLAELLVVSQRKTK